MENKNFFRALFWGLLAFLLWSMIAQRVWPPAKPAPPTQTAQQTTTDTGTNGPSGVATATDTLSDAEHDALSDTSDTRPVGLSVRQAPEAVTLTLGQTEGFDKSPYRMQLWLSNVGASVETVRLSDHRQNVRTEDRYRLLVPVEHEGRTWRSFAVERVIIDDSQRVDLHHARWRATTEPVDDGQCVTFAAEIVEGETPVIAIERKFCIRPQPAASGRHDVDLVTTVRNLTDTVHRVQLVELGPIGITREGRFRQDQKIFAAVAEADLMDLEVATFDQVGKKDDVALYPREEGDTSPLTWYGAGNLYFSATLCPVDQSGKALTHQIKTVRAIDIDRDKATTDDVTLRAATPVMAVAAGASRTLHTSLYLGPKDRDVFEDPANANYVARDYMLQIKEGYGSCTFNFLTDMMIGLLNWLHGVFGNFGVAIIVLVLVVRTLLHPITKKTQVNMVKVQQRMGKLHPKIAELKKRFGNDAMKLNQATMKLYREEGINPMSQGMSCLPMMLQMPIWIALYTSLRNNVAMRCEGFIWWINDLTAPDALVAFSAPFTIPLVGWKITAFNLLPFLVGLVMFAQQKLMPKPKQEVAVDSPQAQQAQQMQKIMPYMSLMMIIFFYNLPSGLNLYIMTSSLIGAIEQLYIRRHIKQQDLNGPAKSAATAGSPRRSSLMDWLQKKAEDAQKLPSQRDPGRKRR